jgi:hypothetical protein
LVERKSSFVLKRDVTIGDIASAIFLSSSSLYSLLSDIPEKDRCMLDSFPSECPVRFKSSVLSSILPRLQFDVDRDYGLLLYFKDYQIMSATLSNQKNCDYFCSLTSLDVSAVNI